MGGFISAIKQISDASGVPLDPADELRFIGDFAVSTVTGDGPTRVEVRSAAVAAATASPRPGLLAADAVDFRSGIVVAALASVPVAIRKVSFMPAGSLAVSASNFTDVDLREYDATGTLVAIRFSATTSTATGTTGNWTSYVTAFAYQANFTLPVGHILADSWQQRGAGVDIPPGSWIIT